MKTININNFTISFYLFFILCSFLYIHIGNINIKAYMIVTVIYTFIYFHKIKFTRLYLYEVLWIFSYICILISANYATDIYLAIKLIFGEIILILSYLILRYLVLNITLLQFEKLFSNIGRLFILISIILYIMGIIYIYLDYQPTKDMYLNEYSIRIYGLYLEGFFPRFMGLSESPNNYFYSGFLFLCFYFYKREWKMFVVTLISLLLTLSGTGIIVLIFSYFIFIFYNKRLILSTLLLLIVLSLLILTLYEYNNEIQYLIDYRIDRLITGSGRFQLWAKALDIIGDSPLLGYGANQSRILLEILERNYQSAHNSFLDMFLMSGVIGLLIYFFLYISILILSLQLSRYYETSIFIVLFFNYFLISMSNNTLHIDYILLYFIFIFIYSYSMHDNKIKF